MNYFTTNINEDFINDEQNFPLNSEEETFYDQPSFTSMSSIDMNEDSLIHNNEDKHPIDIEEPQITITINKKLTREDLRIIPLPIFNCFYCANDEVAFCLLISDYFSKEYLYTITSNDIDNITKAITSPFQSKIGQFAMNHSEVLQKSYDTHEINSFFTSEKFSLRTYELINKTSTSQTHKKSNENLNKKDEARNNEHDSFLKINRFDITKKIKASDISYEEEAFDIWNPTFLDEGFDSNENSQQEDEYKYDKIIDNQSCSLSLASTTYAGSITTTNGDNNSMNEHNGCLNLFTFPCDNGKKDIIIIPSTLKSSIISN